MSRRPSCQAPSLCVAGPTAVFAGGATQPAKVLLPGALLQHRPQSAHQKMTCSSVLASAPRRSMKVVNEQAFPALVLKLWIAQPWARRGWRPDASPGSPHGAGMASDVRRTIGGCRETGLCEAGISYVRGQEKKDDVVPLGAQEQVWVARRVGATPQNACISSSNRPDSPNLESC